MGLFSRDRKIKALLAICSKHARDLGELQKDQALLTSQFRNLELEWMNAFEKLKSISGRIAKRQALDGVLEPEKLVESGNGETDPDPYANLDPVSAGIMRRRDAGRHR